MTWQPPEDREHKYRCLAYLKRFNGTFVRWEIIQWDKELGNWLHMGKKVADSDIVDFRELPSPLD